MTITIDELMQKSHTMAVDKGWWPDGTSRSIAEQVNNFHAEISEAWEEYRAGRMDTWWSRKGEHGELYTDSDPNQRHYSQTPENYVKHGWKPEGFWTEIADLCIRLADTMRAYGWESEPDQELVNDQAKNLARFIGSLHLAIGDFYDENADKWSPVAPSDAGPIIAVCVAVAKLNGVDLLALCELKMSYNATRPQRHGGKRA